MPSTPTLPPAPTQPRKRASPVVVAIVLLACLGLSACGNSSSSTVTTTAAAPSATTTASATTSTSAATTTAATSSSKPAQQAAPHFAAAFRHALTAFAACMRHNGVPLPAPDTSGKGPVFKTGSLDTASAAFKTASTKCQSILRSALPRRAKR